MNLCSIVFFFLLSCFSGTSGYTAQGKASFYADRMQGQPTASGENYDKNLYTAAHATLPFNTRVLITNLRNGKTVVVRINDRKARNRHNIIDLSRAAASAIDMVRAGSATVKVAEVKNGAAEQQQPPIAVSEAEANR